jgi:biotin carboxyl carrier protein
MDRSFRIGSKDHRVGLRETAKGEFEVTVDGVRHRVLVESPGGGELLLIIDGRIYNAIVSSDMLAESVEVNGRQFKIEKGTAPNAPAEGRGRSGRRDVKISMPGRVVEVLAAAGDAVGEGQPVLVVEAMKMQNEMKSPQAGRLSGVFFKAGDYVEAGAVLFTVE